MNKWWLDLPETSDHSYDVDYNAVFSWLLKDEEKWQDTLANQATEKEKGLIAARLNETSPKLRDYINQHHGGSQRAFAAVQGVLPQQVQKWITKGYIIVDGVLYSPRREVYTTPELLTT